MRNVSLATAFTGFVLGIGQVAGDIKYELISVSDPEFEHRIIVGDQTGSAEFDNVPPGSYYVQGWREDSVGTVLGSPVASNILAVADTQTVVVPASITISVV